eukprot:TRINITY_DN6081_c0_g1_i1.p1 TRINITY_DN6081_c0_g1~~TRINITY_DN6081_c0_g1_i1.p1  ORF type:complete len:932 (-),score=237.93 TRINITY_DN6081_c0_g1_i1:137-2932(-)
MMNFDLTSFGNSSNKKDNDWASFGTSNSSGSSSKTFGGLNLDELYSSNEVSSSIEVSTPSSTSSQPTSSLSGGFDLTHQASSTSLNPTSSSSTPFSSFSFPPATGMTLNTQSTQGSRSINFDDDSELFSSAPPIVTSSISVSSNKVLTPSGSLGSTTSIGLSFDNTSNLSSASPSSSTFNEGFSLNLSSTSSSLNSSVSQKPSVDIVSSLSSSSSLSNESGISNASSISSLGSTSNTFDISTSSSSIGSSSLDFGSSFAISSGLNSSSSSSSSLSSTPKTSGFGDDLAFNFPAISSVSVGSSFSGSPLSTSLVGPSSEKIGLVLEPINQSSTSQLSNLSTPNSTSSTTKSMSFDASFDIIRTPTNVGPTSGGFDLSVPSVINIAAPAAPAAPSAVVVPSETQQTPSNLEALGKFFEQNDNPSKPKAPTKQPDQPPPLNPKQNTSNTTYVPSNLPAYTPNAPSIPQGFDMVPIQSSKTQSVKSTQAPPEEKKDKGIFGKILESTTTAVSSILPISSSSTPAAPTAGPNTQSKQPSKASEILGKLWTAECFILNIVDTPKSEGTFQKTVSFRVSSKTKIAHFGKEIMAVTRTTADFSFLHQTLVMTFPFILVPYPPEHKTSFFDDESELVYVSSEYQTYLSRVTRHPVLAHSEIMKHFLLENDAEFKERRKRFESENQKTNNKGKSGWNFLATNSSTTSSNSASSRDPNITKLKLELKDLETQLKETQHAAHELQKKSKELVPLDTNWAQLISSFTTRSTESLGRHGGKDFSSKMISFSQSFGKSAFHHKKAVSAAQNSEYLQYEMIKELRRYIKAALGYIDRYDEIFERHYTCSQENKKQKQIYEDFIKSQSVGISGNESNKMNEILANLNSSQQELDNARVMYDKAQAEFWNEIKRFYRYKTCELNHWIKYFSQSKVKELNDQLSMWKEYI